MAVWQTKSKLRWPLQHKWLSLLALVVLGVAGFFVYQRIALELNRLAFKDAQHAIDTLYADIAAQVGQPDDQKQNYYCGGFRGEFGEGPLSCYLDTSFIFGVNDKQQSDQFISKIKNVINAKSSFKPDPKPSAPSVNTSSGRLSHDSK